MNPYFCFVVALVCAGLILFKPAPPKAAPIQATSAPAPRDEREHFARDLLEMLGNTQPSGETVNFIVAWQRAENTAATFNPLATTQDEPGATLLAGNPDGVKNYPNYATGLDATVTTLTNGRYPNILAGLQANDPARALNSDELGTWGTGYAAVAAQWHGAQLDSSSGTRQQLVAYALSLQGIPYVRGGRSASGGDCSGTMEHIYLTVTGIDIGGTTFAQFPRWPAIDLSQAQPGDLWFGQYSDDQHVGMLCDCDGDGRWDLLNNGGPADNMHVDYDFLAMPYFSEHTMGYRRVIE